MATSRVLLITGNPGAGKTTLLRKVAASLARRRLGGFYTEELRAGRERRGFRLATFDGREAVMAHVDFPGPHRVGRYGVDVSTIDRLAGSALTPSDAVDLYLVDEIGKMECLSERFVAAMRGLLRSSAPVVATIARRGGGFIAEIREQSGAELWELTRGNRDGMAERVLGWLARAESRRPQGGPAL